MNYSLNDELKRKISEKYKFSFENDFYETLSFLRRYHSFLDNVKTIPEVNVLKKIVLEIDYYDEETINRHFRRFFDKFDNVKDLVIISDAKLKSSKTRYLSELKNYIADLEFLESIEISDKIQNKMITNKKLIFIDDIIGTGETAKCIFNRIISKSEKNILSELGVSFEVIAFAKCKEEYSFFINNNIVFEHCSVLLNNIYYKGFTPDELEIIKKLEGKFNSSSNYEQKVLFSNNYYSPNNNLKLLWSFNRDSPVKWIPFLLRIREFKKGNSYDGKSLEKTQMNHIQTCISDYGENFSMIDEKKQLEKFILNNLRYKSKCKKIREGMTDSFNSNEMISKFFNDSYPLNPSYENIYHNSFKELLEYIYFQFLSRLEKTYIAPM